MLTKSEIDAITKEAEKFAMQYLPPEEKWKEHHEIKFNEMTHYYTAGATEERQRAAILMDALVRIYNENSGLEELCRQAINTYNKNKP